MHFELTGHANLCITFVAAPFDADAAAKQSVRFHHDDDAVLMKMEGRERAYDAASGYQYALYSEYQQQFDLV